MTAASAPPELLLSAGRLVTCDAETGSDELGVVEDGAVLLAGGRVQAVGPRAALVRAHHGAAHHAHPGALITPGLVDAHTHAAWVGSRGREYAMRMAGADYEAIAAAGGGITASMRAVRETSDERLEQTLVARLGRMASLGVTTVEIKSGYGLSEAHERRQLEAVARVSRRADLPAVVPTFLGLHALPPEAGADRDGYAAACRGWLDGIARDGLAAFVDAYVDRSAFSVAQARLVLERAAELGLGVRLHAGQFADVGGVELGVSLGAASVDHLEHVGEEAAEAMGRAGVAAVLLPVASFTLAQAPPPVAMLRRCGVPLVVASDANPGTAPTESLPLALALAVRSYGLTAAEALLGATARAADSLRQGDRGRLRTGAAADVVVWDLPHEHDLLQPWGVARTLAVYREGVRIGPR